MLDATGKVANRVKNFTLRFAQIFLRCVALSHIELVLDKLFLLLADAALKVPDISGYGAAHPVDHPLP
jgi:hypothetical protein